jgi:outer membrane immunogenic protein
MRAIRMTSFIAAGSAIAMLATPAFAQDESRSSYDGVYVAGSLGAAIQRNDRDDIVVFDVNPNGTFGDTVTTSTGANAFGPATAPTASGGFCSGGAITTRLDGGCSGDEDDLEYAVKVGVDGQLGTNFVVGVLVEGSMTNAKDYTTAFSTTPANYFFSRGLDYAVSARGRFGFTPDGSGLFYVTGGPSYAKLDHGFTTSNVVNSFEQRGGNKVWGYQAGGGAEYTLAQGLGIGIEYLYSKYDDEDYYVAIGSLGAATPANNPFIRQGAAGTFFRPSEQDFAFHSIRVNAIYKF